MSQHIASHMLWLLHVAIDAGFEALSDDDEAVGEMKKNVRQKLWSSHVTLHRGIAWRGARQPTAGEAGTPRVLHRELHQN